MAKKIWELMQEDIERNKQYSENLQREANKNFNNLISKKGAYDTSKHTYRIKDLKKNASKEWYNSFKKTNKLTLWDTIKNFANNSSYVAKKTGSGAISGITGIAQGKLTDTISNMNKGEKMNNTEAIQSMIKFLSPNIGNIMDSMESGNKTINILKDKDKNAWQKVSEIGLNSVERFKKQTDINNFAEVEKMAGKINPNANTTLMKINSKISEPVEKYNELLQKESENYGDTTKFLGDVGYSIGNMSPSIIASTVTKDPSVGLATMGMSVKGQATQDALNKGQDLETAVKIGDAKALVEVATEKLSGGLGMFGKGSVDDIAEEFIKKGSKSTLGRFLLKQGYNISGEVTEEEISNIINNIIDKGTTDPNKKIFDIKEALDIAKTTAFATGILNGITGGYANDYNQARDSVVNSQYKDYNTNKTLDNDIQNQLQKAENIINKNQTTNLQPQSTQEQQILPTQQINQQENKMFKNGNIEQINPFNGYTENEMNKLKSDKISIAKSSEDIVSFVNNSKTFPGNFKMYVGKIKESVAKIINEKLGFNIDNYNISLKTDAIRHVLNQHSNSNESQKGQVPITVEDFKNIPEIINNPDNILDSGETKQGKPVIKFEKNIDGNNVVVTYVSDKHKNLELQTMYKFKNNKKIDSVTMSNAINTLDRTSETNSDTNLINNIIPQNNQNMQVQQEISNEASINLPKNTDSKKIKFENDNLIQESNKISDEEIAQILTEIKGRTNEKRKLSAFLKANLIDKGMVFEELARKTNNRDLQGKYDYTLTAEARGQNAIGNARYDYRTAIENGKIKKGNKNAKQISKSLTDIIDEVGENPTDFYNYMYHQLNIDRMTLEERFGGDTGVNYERKNPIKNKPVFGKGITAEISQKYVQELEQKHPEFKEYAQDVYDFLDANTKELVDNGVISKETQELFKEMYPHYVPISRVTNKGQAINVPLDTGRTGVNSPIKRAKGGNRDINPLFQTMADRTLQTYRASARNNFGIELKNTLDKAKQLNQIIELTDIDSIMESMTDEEQNNNLLQEGVNGENPTFTVFENGEKVTYEISKDMYDALKPKNELLKRFDNSALSKGLNKVNNFRRGLLTEYNPVFSITNAIKDAQDVLLNSQHSAKTYSKIPEATAQIVSKGYWYKEYIQNGGEQNSYFRDGEFEASKKTLPTKAKEVVNLPLKAISNVNNVIEMTPRLAEYIVSRQQGKSIETSMLDASRVTTNFKAGGDITKTLNRNGFTFLNASVQGMQQQIRNIQEANAKGLKGYAVLAIKYAIAGLPVLILNNLIWNDDEEYEELQDYVKDNYYIIGKTENGTFIRIPKGRAVATIQKIVSNADEFVKKAKTTSILDIDELGSQFWNDLKEDISFAKDNLAPNNPFENWVGAPIKQVWSNKTWYGEALVPTRLQDKPKEEQYDETTDEISKWIGEHLKVSPMKVNYLLDQYSGGVGDILLPKLTPQAENTVLEDKFSTVPVMKNKYPGEFFEKIDELNINKNSEKATDEDKVKYQYMSSVQNEMNDLYKEKREVQNSKATDEEKKKQLKEVQKKINDLAKNSLEKVDKITKGTNYAQIDTKQYYKDIEGKWKSVSEKDIEKNNKSGLSLKTYSSYKYEMSKVKQEKINKGEMTEEQSLKDSEQIQILLDSNYSDKEKTTIYEKYIKTQIKEGEYDSFKVIKAANINIDEYLKYEQQEFKSDKDDDGTLDGKTVSKSKQKKVENYLNSMNIDENQWLLLYAMNGYSINLNQKTQLANYVYGLNLDKETKLELYDKFSGFTVYKDGRVKW